jgi:hypothetical protein
MFTVSTFAMLILGILAHALKQLVGAKRVGSGLAARQYFLEYWPETLLAVVCSLAMYFGLPEMAQIFPDLAAQIGLPPRPVMILSFFAGFLGNSLADLLGGRISRLVQ